MPAHLIELDHECVQNGCTQRATVQVRNTWNEKVGDYCLKDGRKMVARMNNDIETGPKRR